MNQIFVFGGETCEACQTCGEDEIFCECKEFGLAELQSGVSMLWTLGVFYAVMLFVVLMVSTIFGGS